METKKPSGVKYEHSDGQTVFTNQLNDQTFTVAWSEYSDEIKQRLLEYGIQQKFSDFKVGHFSGKEPLLTKEERLSVMEELHEMLLAGEWKAKREGGSGISISGILAKIPSMKKAEKELMKTLFKDNEKIIKALEA